LARWRAVRLDMHGDAVLRVSEDGEVSTLIELD
jgi:hypothetical protein